MTADGPATIEWGRTLGVHIVTNVTTGQHLVCSFRDLRAVRRDRRYRRSCRTERTRTPARSVKIDRSSLTWIDAPGAVISSTNT